MPVKLAALVAAMAGVVVMGVGAAAMMLLWDEEALLRYSAIAEGSELRFGALSSGVGMLGISDTGGIAIGVSCGWGIVTVGDGAASVRRAGAAEGGIGCVIGVLEGGGGLATGGISGSGILRGA